MSENIKDYISRHALSPGDRIPSVMELCARFQVSHTTVRAALKVLGEEGVVESRHRQCVFVAPRRAAKLSLYGQQAIAVLVPNGEYSYEAGIIRGVTEQSQLEGYRVIIANSADNAEKEAAQLSELFYTNCNPTPSNRTVYTRAIALGFERKNPPIVIPRNLTRLRLEKG